MLVNPVIFIYACNCGGQVASYLSADQSHTGTVFQGYVTTGKPSQVCPFFVYAAANPINMSGSDCKTSQEASRVDLRLLSHYEARRLSPASAKLDGAKAQSWMGR